MAEPAKTGSNQKVRIAHSERFYWISAKNYNETAWGAAPHWSAEISWTIVSLLGEKSVNVFFPPPPSRLIRVFRCLLVFFGGVAGYVACFYLVKFSYAIMLLVESTWSQIRKVPTKYPQ